MQIFKRTKRRCRICKEQVSRNGYLYKCQKSKGMHAFWHRSVLSENLDDEDVLKDVLNEANIPIVKKKKATHFVYVIKLSGNPKNSVYGGMTGHHPYQRYLNTYVIRGIVKRTYFMNIFPIIVSYIILTCNT